MKPRIHDEAISAILHSIKSKTVIPVAYIWKLAMHNHKGLNDLDFIGGSGYTARMILFMKWGFLMSTDYTRQELIQKVLAASPDVPTFYQQDFINYTGKTKDTKEYYTEVVAEWIIENIQLLRQIPQITRSASYKTPSHDVVVINAASNRTEEQIAKEMRLLEELPLVGKILDYQTPLKNKQSDHAGKIDLLAYDGTTLRILELKEPDSKETMLRCILEGYTYLQTVNQKKLLKNFDLPENTPVIANPFVFFGGHQYCEMQEDRPMLKRLILLLNSKPLYIKQQGNRYDVVADLR